MNPRSSQYKVAFTGTNSSGKTTIALTTAGRLKESHVLAEVVSSQDRKITWKDEHFPVDPRAHFGMISNLVKAEVEAELKGDALIVVTDRSVLDLYAIALTDHPDHPWVTQGLWEYVKAWVQSYARIYYLPPLAYQEDGKRPPDEFRMRTHATLRRLIEAHKFENVVEMPREAIFKDITTMIGVHVPNPIYAETEKWQAVAQQLRCSVRVKDQANASSDVDVWVYADSNPLVLRYHAEEIIRAYFGDQIQFDVMPIPAAASSIEPKGKTILYKA
jgi:nicotinamide riboside kinase